MIRRTGKIRDVVELAVLRLQQAPGSYDPARLFRELDRQHKIELIERILAEMPRGWSYRVKGSARFARWIALKAEHGDRAVEVARLSLAPSVGC